MLRFAAYTRVSSDRQSSQTDQFKEIAAYVLRVGGSIVMSETDVETGHEDRRPGYQSMREAARHQEIDAVVVWKIDRLGRDSIESMQAAAELDGLGVEVHSVTEPAIQDPFIRDFMFILANRESRVLSQRVTLRQKGNVLEGNWQWPAPIGYRIVYRTPNDKTNRRPQLEPNAEATKVRRLFELAATGQYSLNQLRSEAQSIGLLSTKGFVMGRSTLQALLTNPVYAGDIAYGRHRHGRFSGKKGLQPRDQWTVVADAHPAVVERDLFVRVQQVFADHKRFQGTVRRTGYLLTSHIRCAHCGERMYGTAGAHGYSYFCRRGREYGTCVLNSIGGMGIDGVVKRALRDLAITPEIRALAEAMVKEQEKTRRIEADAQRRNLLRDRQKHDDRRRELATSFLSRGQGVVPIEVYLDLEAREVRALAIIDSELRGLDVAPPIDLTTELAFLEAIDWDELDDQAWREAVELLIDTVAVTKGPKRGNRWTEPDVEIVWTPTAAVIREAVVQFV